MEVLIVLAVTLILLYALFILPQQRRVRAHQQLIASLAVGDEVILTAGIFGRIVELGAEEITFEAAPGVRLRVARQAVLRRIEAADGAEPDRRETGHADANGADANGAETPGAAPDAAGAAADRNDEGSL